MKSQNHEVVADRGQLNTHASSKIENELKIGLIRMLQMNDGNFQCFATPYNGACGQASCIWKDDCLASYVRSLNS